MFADGEVGPFMEERQERGSCLNLTPAGEMK